MVNIVTSSGSVSTQMNMEHDGPTVVETPQNALFRLVDQAGILDTVEDINQEAREDDYNLREEQDVEQPDQYGEEDEQRYGEEQQQPEEEVEDSRPRKKKTTKSRGDKRYDDLVGKLAARSREVDEVARQRDDILQRYQETRDQLEFEKNKRQMESQLLMEKQKLEEDIQKVSEIMLRAQQNNQNEYYVKGNILANELIAKKVQTENAISQLDNYRANQEPEYSEEEIESANKLIELSDPRELRSHAYFDFLTNNPVFDPRDPYNYDEDLSNDFRTIKKDFNKFLKYNGNATFIGTPEYYDELTNLMSNRVNGAFEQPQQKQTRSTRRGNDMRENYNNVQHNINIDENYKNSLGQGVPEGQRRTSGIYPGDQNYAPPQQAQRRPNVMPNTNYRGATSNSQLPSLTPGERMIALQCRMFDTDGRELNDREKLQMYAADKLNLMNNRRG